jgi:hypothetical protein
MNKTELLLELRRLVEERRMGLTDISIALHKLEGEHQAEAEEKLRAELRATDEFASPVDHGDYKPE